MSRPTMRRAISIGSRPSMSRVAMMASVAQHRDAVGDRLHLVQAMGDVEDGDALGAQPADDLEQALGLDRA